VQGLAAKPIVDMDVVVRTAADVRPAIAALETAGYRHEGDLGVAGREAFAQPPGEPRHHLYLCVAGAEPLRRHLALRDHLRRDVQDARAYAALKRGLAARHGAERDAYMEAKTAFVEALLERASQEPS
jgi:GrpB-like predicted nucleotidyltransferase (UPF0157 family)